jgi:hypothetical protein
MEIDDDFGDDEIVVWETENQTIDLGKAQVMVDKYIEENSIIKDMYRYSMSSLKSTLKFFAIWVMKEIEKEKKV